MRTEALKRIALGMLCIAALAACGADEIVTDKELSYQMTVPKLWREIDYGGGGNRFFSTNVRMIFLYVHVTDLQAGESLKETLQDPLNKKLLEDYTLINIQMTKLNSRSGIKLTVERNTHRCAIYYIVAGGHGYAIWTGALKDDFDKHAAEFDAIAKSFKLIEAK